MVCCLLQVKVGDTLDLILNEDKEMDTVLLKRVILKKVVGETRDAERQRVVLRSWKHLQLPRKDVYKQWRPMLWCLIGERSETGTKVVFPIPLSSRLILKLQFANSMRCFLCTTKTDGLSLICSLDSRSHNFHTTVLEDGFNELYWSQMEHKYIQLFRGGLGYVHFIILLLLFSIY